MFLKIKENLNSKIVIKKKFILLFAILIFNPQLNSEISTDINPEAIQNKIIITEKSDYSIYLNNKYAGLTSREVKMYLNKTQISENIFRFSGEAFVLQKTQKDAVIQALPLDTILPIDFTFDTSPANVLQNPFQPQKYSKDNGYPILRNFPNLPNRKFKKEDIGKKWEGTGTVVVKPKQDKSSVRIPVISEFEYKGMVKYQDKDVHHIYAASGIRYKHTDSIGDIDMMKSEGGRKTDIYLDENNKPVFIREKIEEQFFYSNGDTIKHRGFILHFYSDSPNSNNGTNTDQEIGLAAYLPENTKPELNNTQTKPAFTQSEKNNNEKKKIIPNENFDVRRNERGTVINLKNLNFEADKAILLAGEDKKLDEIAKILKEINASFFFVEGHTADIGNYAEQKKLSFDRARTIVAELIKRGVPADKLIYNGAGGTKPIADNNTDEGRTENRRVEITIME